MNNRYREIIEKERRGQLILTALFLSPVLVSALFLGTYGTLIGALLVLVVASFVSYRLYQFVKPGLAIICPVCGEGVLQENYANCPPKTDHNVEHKCGHCRSFFVNAILQSKT